MDSVTLLREQLQTAHQFMAGLLGNLSVDWLPVGSSLWKAPTDIGFLADHFNPGVPFLAYAPLLVLSAVLLALVGRETLRR